MRESQLYPHVETYLNLRFAPSRKPLYGAFLSVPAVTSSAGPAESGQWTRPDLSLVLIWRNKYSPNVNLDLYGFEVKSEAGCDVSAVHEALAQSRHVHYSYVVWHLPTNTRVRAKHQATITDNCRAHGVGLITCSNYENAHDFHIAVEAGRKTPSPNAIDEFIETRFPSAKRKLICDHLRSLSDLL